MATRIKTIEFATQTNIVTLATATNKDLVGSTSIYIPESVVAFRSVTLFVDCSNDVPTTAANLTLPIISIKLDGLAISTATMVNPNVNSGEKEAWIFSRNVTSYFTTNWTGNVMTWSTRVNFTGMNTANHAAKIVITYEYDDTATTHIKTIRIPIESTRTLLTTTFQTIGGATAIPALKGSYLPEASVVIRQIFLEMWSNSATNATTDATWQTRIAGGTAIDTYRQEGALNSATWAHAIVDITSQTLTAATSLECVSLTTTSRFGTVGGMIVVTYEFNESTTTSVYNSLLIGAVDTAGQIGGTTAVDAGAWERSIYIEEPGTITLKESGLCLFQDDSAGYSFLVRVSGDTAAQATYSTYVMTAGGVQCGTYSMVHRIDAAGQNGSAGISLKRGKNLYRVLFYSSTAQAGWNLSGFLILNYTSGKNIDGVGSHSHSLYQHITDNITASGSRVNTSTSIVPALPETDYYLIGYVFYISYNIGPSTDSFFVAESEMINLQGGNGWQTLYTGTSRQDNENRNGVIYGAARTAFKRWKNDTDPDRMDIKTSRKYRLSAGPLETGSMGFWYTYHTIQYTVSGTCTGFSGDGSGIPVDIYRINSATQDEMILSLTTTTGGIFSGVWFDNTEKLYASARQDDTHVGRSADGLAE